jgi:hypothetical protein
MSHSTKKDQPEGEEKDDNISKNKAFARDDMDKNEKTENKNADFGETKEVLKLKKRKILKSLCKIWIYSRSRKET